MLKQISDDPSPGQVRHVTYIPFLADGTCVLIQRDGGYSLPYGTVADGEHYLLDTTLRVPLETAGFRYQRVRPFAIDSDHVYAWIEGDEYTGYRRHVTVPLARCSPEEAAALLRTSGQPALADAVLAAAASYAAEDDESYYADNIRILEPAYLRGSSPQEGSGFGGDAAEWRRARHHITHGIADGGTFLDVGCANGLLMESVVRWCAERRLRIEPYGIDLSAGLVEEARRQLPQWADRIWQGNAIDWLPPDGMRFDYVHLLLDCVPRRRRRELIRHHLANTCRPGTGRLLVSEYGASSAAGGTAAEIVRELGFDCAGQSSPSRRAGRIPAPTAWIYAPPATGAG
ncbi:MAG TPA: class I SAM-dependent methyltransferase [Streptosporangiaceae bacterium]